MIVLRDIYPIAWLIRLGIVTPVMCGMLLLVYLKKLEKNTELMLG
jgi:hypothetical protein